MSNSSQMLLRTSVLALGLLACLTVRTALADVVYLNPVKDNTLIQQTNPATQLSNGQGDLFVGRTNQDGQGPATISIRRGLIVFDVAAAVPVGATIDSVTLTLRDVMGLNGDPVVELHRLTQDWGEGASFQNGGMGAVAQTGDATWLYRFYDAVTPGNSVAWNTAGGDFLATVSASTVISDDAGGLQTFLWNSTSQFVADVQDMLDNSSGNFGWLLSGDESRGQSAKRLNSGESAFLPVLTINFTPAAVPEPSTWLMLGVCGIGALWRARHRAARVA